MIRRDERLTPAALLPAIERMWTLSAERILGLEASWRPEDGAPVVTVSGRYTARGWTEWTQGFQFGSALLQFDATGDAAFLALGRERTLARMAPHITHMGVHDHGFSNVSTYGALRRLAREGRFEPPAGEAALYDLALRCSAAVQARRWTPTADGGGFIYSFNGPHSLFADTIRSLRSLALGHLLGHALLEERDRRVSLLGRLLAHARATARWSVYYGEGRDIYDVRGRVAHESLFDTLDGAYRCPSTQQGYSPFTTWTRGLAWIMLGYAEELELVASLPDADLEPEGGRLAVEADLLRPARAACDHYIETTPADGVPYWDTGAPGLAAMPGWADRPADPGNPHEPVDSSAAAIAAQGLLRLGRLLASTDPEAATRYTGAGLAIARTLLAAPYLCEQPIHQGMLLHSVYHRPNGWDYVPPGASAPRGEASQWGDYHLRELALLLGRIARSQPYYTFFGPA